MKQVIVVRKDLNMRKGKMIAQGAHASLGAFKATTYENVMEWQKGYNGTKIAVGVDSLTELLDIAEKVRDAGIPAYLVTDAGYTEFKGERTITALGIGPWNREELDEITGHLKLL